MDEHFTALLLLGIHAVFEYILMGANERSMNDTWS